MPLPSAPVRCRAKGIKSRLNTLVLSLIMTGFAGGPAASQSGEEIARTWCGSCHAYPEPSLLDRQTWTDHVLPQMGARLGIWSYRGRDYGIDVNTPDGIYSDVPLINPDDWERIVSFYETEAPETLVLPDQAPRLPVSLFTIETPEERSDFPTSTAILIDEASHNLLLGDSHALDLKVFDNDLEIVSELRTGGAISWIKSPPDGPYLVTTMGGDIGQGEQPFGLLLSVDPTTGKLSRLIRRLRRPVTMRDGDFNHDGRPDFLVAEFGTHSGKLSLHLSQPDGTLAARVLAEDAGATSLAIDDDDLLVLMAQGDERILRFRDFAGANPTEEVLLRFPPSQGSSSMTVSDVTGDGLPDILYTAGDNADISPIYKPYHGVYLFEGAADGSFRQTLFFHLDGATSAVAADFDMDGDQDIAAIAYYLNAARNPDDATFVFLENTGDGFLPGTIDGIGLLGRFVAITAGDIDGDGDKDIALANMAFGPYGPMVIPPARQHIWLEGPPFILLRNTTLSSE